MYADELVVFSDVDRDQAASVDPRIIGKRCLLHDTGSCRHREERAGLKVSDRDDRPDLLVCFELEEVNDGSTLCGTSSFRNLIALHAEYTASVCKAQEEVMCGRCDDLRDIVLFVGRQTGNTAAATMLASVCVDRAALHVTEVGQRDHDLLFLDERLIIDLVFIRRSDLCSSVFVILLLDLEDLVLDYLTQKLLIIDNGSEVSDLLVEFFCLGFELFSFQTCQTTETHIDDVLRLLVGETETLAQSLLCLILSSRRTDDLDNFVDVIDRDQETFNNVLSGQCFFQIVLGTTKNNIFLVSDIVCERVHQVDGLRLKTTLGIRNEREHVGAESVLDLRVLIKLIENNVSVGVTAELDNDTYLFVTVGLITDIGDAFDLLLLNEFGDTLDETSLVDHVGQIVNDDTRTAVAHDFDICMGTDYDTALTCSVCIGDTAASEDHTACREVRSFYHGHKIVNGRFRIIQEHNDTVDDLAHVVRRNVGRHTYGDTDGTVYQKVRETRRKSDRLDIVFVEVRAEINSTLVDIAHHFHGDLLKSGLRITVSSRRVTVHGTEVTMAFYQHITHGEVLRQTYEGIVYGCVAVRMETTENVTYGGGALTVRLVRGKTLSEHRIEDSSVYRLKTVTDIRQSTVRDNAHRIVDERLFHFFFQVDRDDRCLLRAEDRVHFGFLCFAQILAGKWFVCRIRHASFSFIL